MSVIVKGCGGENVTPAQAYEITSAAINVDDSLNSFLIQSVYTNILSFMGVYGGGNNDSYEYKCLAFFEGDFGWIETFGQNKEGSYEREVTDCSVYFDNGEVSFDFMAVEYPIAYIPSTLELVVVGSPFVD